MKKLVTALVAVSATSAMAFESSRDFSKEVAGALQNIGRASVNLSGDMSGITGQTLTDLGQISEQYILEPVMDASQATGDAAMKYVLRPAARMAKASAERTADIASASGEFTMDNVLVPAKELASAAGASSKNLSVASYQEVLVPMGQFSKNHVLVPIKNGVTAAGKSINKYVLVPTVEAAKITAQDVSELGQASWNHVLVPVGQFTADTATATGEFVVEYTYTPVADFVSASAAWSKDQALISYDISKGAVQVSGDLSTGASELSGQSVGATVDAGKEISGLPSKARQKRAQQRKAGKDLYNN